MHAIATFVVFRAAFLWRIMREYGIPEKLINFIRNTYRGCNARVRVGADAADLFCIETGVSQGCVWSALLFGLLINWVLLKACDKPLFVSSE